MIIELKLEECRMKTNKIVNEFKAGLEDGFFTKEDSEKLIGKPYIIIDNNKRLTKIGLEDGFFTKEDSEELIGKPYIIIDNNKRLMNIGDRIIRHMTGKTMQIMDKDNFFETYEIMDKDNFFETYEIIPR